MAVVKMCLSGTHVELLRLHLIQEPSVSSDIAAESRRDVGHLMRRQKVQGDADDWIPGYEAEMEKVTRSRLRKLDPTKAAKVASETTQASARPFALT